MSAVSGVIGGALALTALQAVVSSDAATNRLGVFANVASSAVRRVVDVNVPLIPDLRK